MSRGIVGKFSETHGCWTVECLDRTSVLEITWCLFSNIYIISTGLCGPTATSATPEKVDDEDEDFDEEDSAEADDVINLQKTKN